MRRLRATTARLTVLAAVSLVDAIFVVHVCALRVLFKRGTLEHAHAHAGGSLHRSLCQGHRVCMHLCVCMYLTLHPTPLAVAGQSCAKIALWLHISSIRGGLAISALLAVKEALEFRAEAWELKAAWLSQHRSRCCGTVSVAERERRRAHVRGSLLRCGAAPAPHVISFA